uniref:Uncharacterized protein n=1 Tax=Nothobranchius kuhntae TaxID=321403 RepID=A0A1A8K219_NOTKU
MEESAHFNLAHASSRHDEEFFSNPYPLIMVTTRMSSYDAAFKLKAIDLAVKEGNSAAAHGSGKNSFKPASPGDDDSNTDSDTDIATEKVCDEALLRLFNSDTEEEDFNGFSAQEEDESE